MASFSSALRVLAIACLAVSAIHLILGSSGAWLVGVKWPDNHVFDPSLDSQDRFYGAVFAIYGALLWISSSRLASYGTVLRIVFAVFFCGGLARITSMVAVGFPAPQIWFLLASELLLPPILWFWMNKIEGQIQ